MVTPPAALQVQGLRKAYGDVVAVAGLDLEVRTGECFGLLGPNGAGKTTTIEICEGLLAPDSGSVVVLDKTWEANARDLQERLGIQLQDTQLAEKLTVDETLTLFQSFYREARNVEDVIDMVELGEKRFARVGTLSGGQKQRLAVACALVGDPAILFLDEPTTGLDPQSRIQLWETVARFRRTGGTVLLTTHYMEEAERLCDRVAIVDHGRLIAVGTPRELIARLEAANIIEFTSDPPIESAVFEGLTGFHGCTRRKDGWLLRVESLAEAVPQVITLIERNNAKLRTLSTHAATLEDLFVSLTGRELRDV